jgi:RND family efflux transporter MFP subunit
VPVERAAVDRSVSASGAIAAWEEMQLGVEVSGLRVARVEVEVGDQVERGALLVALDGRTIDSELRQAAAALEEAEAALVLARSNLERGRQLRSRQLISTAELDQLGAGVVQAQARVSTTAALRDAARLRLDYATLRAPDAGVISRRDVQPGQVVMAGDEMLRLIRQGRLEWRAALAEGDLVAIQPGMGAVLTAPDGSVVEGSVRAVSPSLDVATRTGTVYVDLPQPGGLRAGMFAQGAIRLGDTPGLTVPLSSVVRRDGYAYVFVVDAKQRVAQRRIEVGRVSGGRIEILDGVAEGEQVVGRGAGFLSDGDRVRVVAADVAAANP